MMSFGFEQPLLLLLLIPVTIFVVYLWKTSRARTPVAVNQASLILRLLCTWILIFGLAGVSEYKEGKGLSIVVLRDLSQSVPRLESDSALSQISNRIGDLKAPDQVGLISFGRDSRLEQGMSLNLGNGKATSLDNSSTDIASALRYSASFLNSNSGGGLKRIILISDGNTTEGDALREARNLAVSGIPIDVWPISYDRLNEILVESVTAPEMVAPGQVFGVDAVIDSSSNSKAQVILRESDTVIAEREVDLGVGKNRVSFSLDPSEKINRKFTVSVIPATGADSTFVNNSGATLVRMRKPSRVLVVSENQDSRIVDHLAGSKILVDQMSPSQLTVSAFDYSEYSAVVLDDVSSFLFEKQQTQLLERLVHDNGLGLLMVGGPNSFGPGGWGGTPVETALPVSMDIRQRKVVPNGALVVILHTCEFNQGNLWARQITKSSIRGLTAKDYFGVLIYKNGVDGWGIPLSPVDDIANLNAVISSLSPEDMLQFEPSMSMAFTALTGSESPATFSKHVVIISDGDPTPPSNELLMGFANNSIKISTICIQPHSGEFPELALRKISDSTGGRFYRMDDPSQLPRIFFREALRVRKNLILEKRFQPILRESSEIVGGLNETDIPPIDGIVLTTLKPLARAILVNDEDDPLLSTRRHGIGVTAAFSSDSGDRWSGDWVSWEGNRTFWAQLLRSISKVEENKYLQATTRVDGRGGVLIIDAIDAEGRFVDGLQFDGSVLNPELTSKDLEIKQEGPGRYIGHFPVRERGDYLVRVEATNKEGEVEGLSRYFTVGYPAEFRSLKSNEEFLGKIADVSGGRVIDDESDLLDKSGPNTNSQSLLWPQLTMLALCLFFFDAAIRRIQLEPFFRSKKQKANVAEMSEEETATVAASPGRRFGRSARSGAGDQNPDPDSSAKKTGELENEESEDLKALLRVRRKNRRQSSSGDSENPDNLG